MNNAWMLLQLLKMPEQDATDLLIRLYETKSKLHPDATYELLYRTDRHELGLFCGLPNRNTHQIVVVTLDGVSFGSTSVYSGYDWLYQQLTILSRASKVDNLV